MAQLAAFSPGRAVGADEHQARPDAAILDAGAGDASIIGRTITSADGETTGKVGEVRLISNGIVAVLESGKEVAVGPGVTIPRARGC